MSINFEFHKLKKITQESLYSSIDRVLGISNSQVYLPFFSKYIKFHNKYSKKMFNLKGDFTLLEIISADEDTKKKLQGKIKLKLIKNEFYSKAKDFNDYKNYIIEKEVFIKSNPILDVLKFMEGDYEFNSIIPSNESNLTNKKINNHNNNAYIENMGCYILNKLNKKNYTSIFPEYYGGFNGIAESYEHDISEDYNFISNDDWFNERNGVDFDLIYDNNLDDYQKLSLENLEKLDYKKEKQEKKTDIEIENLDEILDEEEIEIDLEEIYKKEQLETSSINKLSDNEENISDEGSVSDENSDIGISDDDSNASWSTINSDESVLCAEYWVKLKKVPIQILCMESYNLTLTDLEKEGINEDEWLSILFQICFGLSAAQEHIGFIHNDLHSDNIMFKKIDEEFKYFRYQDIYFRIPTFGKELKIIDFARGIFKIKNQIYYSDVFERNGDAGGQYGNPPSIFLKKKLNYNFDLARLSTTIVEFFDSDSPIFDLLVGWTGYKEEGIERNFNQLDDNFNLYVTITKYARNSLPKNQLLKEIFNLFRILPEDIPKDSLIYQF